jgi:acyl carrier protein
MSNIPERVRKILVSKFDVAEADLTPEMTFKDGLGADSLDTVELAMAFEKEFGIEISDADVESINTVGDAERFITKAL